MTIIDKLDIHKNNRTSIKPSFNLFFFINNNFYISNNLFIDFTMIISVLSFVV